MSWEESGAGLTLVKKGAGDWTEAIIGAIDASTAIVSHPELSLDEWALIDLEKVSDQTHAVGAALVSMPARPWAPIRGHPADHPDFLVSVGINGCWAVWARLFICAPKWRKGQSRPIEYSCCESRSDNLPSW